MAQNKRTRQTLQQIRPAQRGSPALGDDPIVSETSFTSPFEPGRGSEKHNRAIAA